MRTFLALLVTLVASVPLSAQALTNTQTVSWTAPTQFVDGSSIPAGTVLTYNVYAKLGGAAEVKLGAALVLASFKTALMPVGQNNCYTISVLVNGGTESARSAESCAVVQSLAAKPVTTVVIQSP